MSQRLPMLKNRRRIEQIAGMVLVGAILFGCVVVIRPFMTAILWAAVLCFATWPAQEFLLRLFRGRRTLTALAMTVALLFVLFVPFFVVGLSLADNIRDVMAWLDSHRQAGFPPMPEWVGRLPFVGETVQEFWNDLSSNTAYAFERMKPMLKEIGSWLLQNSLGFARGIFQLALSLFIVFFFYRDGEGAVLRLREGSKRLAGEYAQHLLEVAGRTVQGVVYGVIGTALAQGILAGVGLAIAGVPSAVLLATLTFFLSVVPVGPPLVWIGAAIWLFNQGHTAWGLFMIAYGGLVISGVDNIVKPYLISRGSRLPFALTLLGVMGGVLAFGFIGLFLGPTLLAVGYTLGRELLRKDEKLVSSPPADQSTAASSG